MSISAYTILAGNSIHELTEGVNAFIKNGWQPHGNMTYIPSSEIEGWKEEFHQPMVKYENVSKEALGYIPPHSRGGGL